MPIEAAAVLSNRVRKIAMDPALLTMFAHSEYNIYAEFQKGILQIHGGNYVYSQPIFKILSRADSSVNLYTMPY